jgi:hypothetical protein
MSLTVRKCFHPSTHLPTHPYVGLLGRGISPTQGHYLHRTTQTQNKLSQTSVPSVEFEPTILVLERAKTFHALDHPASVIGEEMYTKDKSQWLLSLRYVARCRGPRTWPARSPVLTTLNSLAGNPLGHCVQPTSIIGQYTAMNPHATAWSRQSSIWRLQFCIDLNCQHIEHLLKIWSYSFRAIFPIFDFFLILSCSVIMITVVCDNSFEFGK